VDLSINAREVGGRTILAVTGELDVHSAGGLERKLADLVAAGSSDLVLDLTELDFLDSTGLGVMVKGLKWAREAGGDLKVVADDDKIVKVFTITGLDSAMSLTSALDDEDTD
jgi:anti-sigma B factor antagonist